MASFMYGALYRFLDSSIALYRIPNSVSKRMVQAKYSGSLRRQPAWRSLGPILISSAEFSLQGSSENWLQKMLIRGPEHDNIPFDLAIPSSNDAGSVLHVVLLWSIDGSKRNLERLRSRVPRSTGEGDHQVAVLVDNSGNLDRKQPVWQQFSMMQMQ